MQHEDHLQVACLTWFREQFKQEAGMMFHIPNGGKRNKIEAGKFVNMGVTAGVPDLQWILPNGKSIFIEMKAEGKTLSQVQKTWIKKAIARNAEVYLVDNMDDFKDLTMYLYLKSVTVAYLNEFQEKIINKLKLVEGDKRLK